MCSELLGLYVDIRTTYTGLETTGSAVQLWLKQSVAVAVHDGARFEA